VLHVFTKNLNAKLTSMIRFIDNKFIKEYQYLALLYLLDFIPNQLIFSKQLSIV